MRTRAVLTLTALLLVSGQSYLSSAGAQPAAAGEPVPADPDRSFRRKIDAIVDAAVTDGFAGGVAILRGEQLVYHRVAGFADAAGKIPVSESTLFHVASIAKYVTATLTLRAVEEGVIALEDPIEPLVPDTRLGRRGTSFLDLLAHRSGLGSSYAAEGKTAAADALAAIDAAPLDEALAGRFRYSNDGYDLVGILLERAYGRLYEQLAREKLLAPAGLEEYAFWGEVDLTDAGRVAQPLRRPPRRLRKRNYGMLGSGGLLITAADLARLQSALKRGRVLGEVSLETLWAPRGAMRLGQATFGAFLLDHPELGRLLSARGYEDWGDNAILNDYLDQDLIVTVVTNKGPKEGSGEPFRSRIAGAIEKQLE